MKKNIYTIVIIVFSILLTSCVNSVADTLTKKSISLEPGMSKNELIAIFGLPEKRAFNGSVEAWQYCETGFASDDYFLIWLNNGRVSGIQNYTNTGVGLCSSYFRSINWESAPDTVIEIRNR